MRQPEFPFAKYRDWGPTPPELPDIDIDGLLELTEWQSKIYRRPILDDITGYYQFFPSENGAAAYVTRASNNRPVLEEGLEPGETLAQKTARQKLHIASSAELATALFWSVAVMRSDVLGTALGQVSDIVDNHERGELPDHIVAYSTDAIADYGYCLQNPVEIDVRGIDHGKALHSQIERVAAGVGSSLLEFGKYASENPQTLFSADGLVAIQATLAEQDRRIAHWSPRHSAVMAAFPEIEPSKEVLYLGVGFSEMFRLHHNLGNLS